MSGARAVGPVVVDWIEAEAYVAPSNGRKGTTSYPFSEMTVGGRVMVVRGRTIHAVRDAINRFCRVQKAKDSKFKRRYAARLAQDQSGQLVKVWRLA